MRAPHSPTVFLMLQKIKTLAASYGLALFLTGVPAQASSTTPIAVPTAAPASVVTPYVLENTEVHALPSKILGRDYELFVSLPDGYTHNQKRYPVLMVTDANYAFPLLRSIARRVGDHGDNLDDFILIGLSYAKGDTPTRSRNRDYTPTDVLKKRTTESEQNSGPYGDGERYRRYLRDEVWPYVLKQFRVDTRKKVFAGHSYGSLLGSHMLLTEPAMFTHYILSSPSLWYDKKLMLAQARSYAQTHKNLPAQVYLLVGEYETVKPGQKDSRYNAEQDMVADLMAFAGHLQSRRNPDLKVRTEVISGEDHLTVNPVSYTRGLLWAFGKK